MGKILEDGSQSGTKTQIGSQGPSKAREEGAKLFATCQGGEGCIQQSKSRRCFPLAVNLVSSFTVLSTHLVYNIVKLKMCISGSTGLFECQIVRKYSHKYALTITVLSIDLACILSVVFFL